MKWFRNMRISWKLILGFILVAVFAGAVGIVGINNIRSMEANDTQLYAYMTEPIAQMSRIATAFQRIRVNMRDMILLTDKAEIQDKEARLAERRDEITTEMAAFESKILSQEGRDAYDAYVSAKGTFDGYIDRLLKQARANNDTQALALLFSDGFYQAEQDEQTAILNLVQMKSDDAKAKSDTNAQLADGAVMGMAWIIAAGAALALLFGIVISRAISNPVRRISAAAELIADGDLNVEVDLDTKDEIGVLAASFRRMSDNLSEVMGNIDAASEQVSSGAKQVSDSSLALSQGATEQASSIEELTSSLEQIAAQTRLNAQNANLANKLAEAAKENAEQGNSQMKNMLKAMDEINEASSSISKIIKVIDEIAFQTNILALNAAVEAARAGQQGKGFAVVAEEVRNLAARSANAAKETTHMIEGSIQKVAAGTRLAANTAEALEKIVDGVTKAASLVNNIDVASGEQASGITQINQAVLQVSQVVQANSAASEQSAAASKELASQAELMRASVGRFKLKKSSYAQPISEAASLEKVAKVQEQQYTVEEHLPAKMDKPMKIKLSDDEFGKYT